MNKTLSIVGSQWGDEGKGKITDIVCKDADYVVRYQGGNNAGHTIEFDQKKYSLHILPSGVFNPSTKIVIANGMVVNPKKLVEEINMLQSHGVSISLYISNRAAMIMPYHEELDEYYENLKLDFKVGTTRKGIGPAYMDKINRSGIRMAEFCDKDIFAKKLSHNLEISNNLLDDTKLTKYSFDQVHPEYEKYAEVLSQYMCDTSLLLDQAVKNGEKIVFEGAQGVMLDIEHGTYPFVTSSSPSSSSIPVNTGIGSHYINNSLGIVKAYTSRVGEGPFPTQIEGDIADLIRETGREYGTTTKRPRRIGWIDLVQLKYAARVSGFTQISIMLLDVLSVAKEIKVCIGYQLDGKEIYTIPPLERDYQNVKPIYKTFTGWNTDITNVLDYNSLPKEALEYLEFIEAELGLPINIVSVGPDRLQTIIRNDIFQ